MADTDACEDSHYTTPLVPENPYDTGGGGGGSCDCDPTSGSYPTTTTLSTEIGGNTGVALSSVSGLDSSKVVIGETLIYDGAGTVGRVIAESGNNLTVQTMTTAGGGGGATETYTIAATDWAAVTGASPYTASATVTATYTIGTDTLAELYNDDPVAFANYGFAIESINGQVLTIYAIEAPTASTTLKVNYKETA